MFTAIIKHKIVLAFSLGINFINSEVPWKTALLLSTIFCLASPIGGGIGATLAASDGESVSMTLLNAILSGLATGTFFYVAFIELISYELTNIGQQHLLVYNSFKTDHNHIHDHNHDCSLTYIHTYVYVIVISHYE